MAREKPLQQTDQEPKLFITSLAEDVNEDDLRNLFQVHGEIVDFFMKTNDKGAFAFVTYGSMEEAEKGKEYSLNYLDVTELSSKTGQSG